MAWNEPGGNGKDPWSGNRKSQSPPDLEEALRKVQKKLGSLLGGKGSGSSFSKKGRTIGFGLIAIIAVIIWGLSGIFIVHPAEQAVVLRFGKYHETLGSGPHWIPRFVDSKYILNVKKVSNFSYTAQMLTKDENIVSVSVAVQFVIGNPNNYLFNVVSPIASLQQATASALRQVIGQTTLDQVLTTGREQVRGEVQNQLVKILELYQAGVTVTDVAMQPAKAPEEVKAAFDDAIKAQEDEQRYINQAQAYARGVVPVAEGNAKRIIQEAEAYQKQVILLSEGEVSRFLALLPEYKKAPIVTRERLYLDAVQSVLSKSSKVLVDVNGSNNMLYLPLDKIIQQRNHQNNNHQASSLSNNQVTMKNGKTTSSSEGRSSYSGRTGRDNYVGRRTY